MEYVQPADGTGRGGDTPGRWVDLVGIDNIRDLGGLPVHGGGTTRFGRVFRSSTPQRLTRADVHRLTGDLRLRTVIDLRGPDEVTREGSGWLARADIRTINLPVRRSTRVANPAADLVPDAHRYDLTGLYRELLAGSVRSVLAAVRLIADPDRHTVIFHCAAGKDRTGLLAALVLDAVGVSQAAIAADYALTGARLARVRDQLDTMPTYAGLPPVDRGVLGVDPKVMTRFLDDLYTEHGGAAQWLLDRGLTKEELTQLREVLVEDER